jgi:hypothetical protein
VGKIIKSINLTKDEHRKPFADIKIINGTKDSLMYLVMTNVELDLYENEKLIESVKNPGNMTYVFADYDTKRKKLVIGSVADGAKMVDTYPVDHSMDPFSFAFDPIKDYLLRTWQYVLILRPPRDGQGFMIIAHKIVSREMLFNDIAREIGSDFKVLCIFIRIDQGFLTSIRLSHLQKLERICGDGI